MIRRDLLSQEDSRSIQKFSSMDIFPNDTQISEAKRYFSQIFLKTYKRVVVTNADEKRVKTGDFYCVEITKDRISVTVVKSIYKHKIEFDFEHKVLIQDGQSVGAEGWAFFKVSLKQVSDDLKHNRVFSFKEKI